MNSVRLKFVAEVIAGQSPPADRVSVSDTGLPFIQGNAEFGPLSPTPKWRCDSSPKIAAPGDTLVSVRAPVGAINLADQSLGIGRGIAAVRPKSSTLTKWIYWVLLHQRETLLSLSTGSTFGAVSGDDVANLRLPTVQNPRLVADFLDHETAEIDAFIADQEELAALCREYEWSRLASLIPYPRQLSELWSGPRSSLVHLKHLGSVTLGKMLDTAPPHAEEHLQPYLRAANVQPLGRLKLEDVKRMRFTEKERVRLDLRAGDVVVVEGGVGGYGRAAYLEEDLSNMGFQNSILRFRPHRHVDGRYVAYALLLLRRIGYIEAVASVSSMPHFTAEKVAETPIPFMELSEQRRIANELDSIWTSAAKLDEDLRLATALAHERRATLISAAVTGQIDVTRRHRPVAEELEEEVLQNA